MNHRTDDNFSLDQLLHPANAFGHPPEVVNDADLTLNEKGAILASWASDACAVEAAPDLRAGPQGPTPDVCTMQRTDASGQEETHAPQRDPCKKERPPCRRSLREPIECLVQAAVRLAFSAASWPAIASSTATLACSIDAIA